MSCILSFSYEDVWYYHTSWMRIGVSTVVVVVYPHNLSSLVASSYLCSKLETAVEMLDPSSSSSSSEEFLSTSLSSRVMSRVCRVPPSARCSRVSHGCTKAEEKSKEEKRERGGEWISELKVVIVLRQMRRRKQSK